MKAKSVGGFWNQTAVADGTYPGRWGGYEVTMLIGGVLVWFATDQGVRGIHIPVLVDVKDGAATIRVVERT